MTALNENTRKKKLSKKKKNLVKQEQILFDDEKDQNEKDQKISIKQPTWRLTYMDNCILKLSSLIKREQLSEQENAIFVWSRRSVIEPYLVDCYVKIHNGRRFILRKITQEMVGHKFGQFSFTRAKYTYKKKNKK